VAENNDTAEEIALSELGITALKRKAEELGIKRKGVGWPMCCPPAGTKADITYAIRANSGGRDTEAAAAAECKFPPAGPTEGIAVAVAHFPAEHAGDLAMSMGDRVVLIETVGPNWFRGRDVTTGEEGIFPQNHVVVKKALPDLEAGRDGKAAHRHDHLVVCIWDFKVRSEINPAASQPPCRSLRTILPGSAPVSKLLSTCAPGKGPDPGALAM